MATIGGMVLRSTKKEETAAFYRVLGISLTEHSHGGPMHFEMMPNDAELVFELYAASQSYKRDAIMIFVEQLEDTLEKLRNFGVPWYGHTHETVTMRFFYTCDPDQRDVLIIQKKS